MSAPSTSLIKILSAGLTSKTKRRWLAGGNNNSRRSHLPVCDVDKCVAHALHGVFCLRHSTPTKPTLQ